ncbi:hypothetical protein NPIL_599171 [Nephila pilipes]|uniref:Uncharacterized protein n=1 Tax=Nephila pilipes TaxID=299642 RepID=A0A8X6NE14_NEPPI|nr:hypothetical protein NPIL_599171 [Nephila pilipes]
MSLLLRALKEDLQEVATDIGIKDVFGMARMGLHKAIIEAEQYNEETEIKYNTEFPEVHIQIRETEAKMLNLQVEEAVYQRKLKRRVMLRKEEENNIKGELKQLAEVEKK